MILKKQNTRMRKSLVGEIREETDEEKMSSPDLASAINL